MIEGVGLKIDKLSVKCEKCSHQAASHSLKGKHECLVYHCECQWFKLPKIEEKK
jgi:hypothetical protein